MAAQDEPTLHVPQDLLANFKFIQILDEDPRSRTANLLGTLSDPKTGEVSKALLLLEKTHFDHGFLEALGGGGDARLKEDGDEEVSAERVSSNSTSLLQRLECLGQNDVYTWLLAWTSSGHAKDQDQSASTTTGAGADIKITLIHPATESHIKKYTSQEKVIIRETPELYEKVVEPWINEQEVSKIAWVYNILEGKKETESVLFRDDDEKEGFVILPDLKWDRSTLSSLYLTCIVQDRTLRSLRDLKKEHLPMLRRIRDTASRVARERFGLGEKRREEERGLRAFVHYHPTFYHLHIHLLSPSFVSHPGSIVGQSHLLDDVIDLLEMGVEMRQRTLTFAMGEGHELIRRLREVGTQGEGEENGEAGRDMQGA